MSDWSQDAASAKKAAENGLRGGTEAVKSAARGAAQTVKDTATEAYATGSDFVREGADTALNAGGYAANTVAAQIRSQPVTAAMVCLGIGFLAGLLVSRRV